MVPPGEVPSIATKSGTSATQASQPGPRGESATTESAAERSAPTKRHTPRWLLAVLVPVLGVGLLMVLVSAAVVVRRPGAPEARALFVLCLAIGLTLITAPDQYH